MSFTIKCDKCGTVAQSIEETGESIDHYIFTDKHKSIVVRSEAGWHGTSILSIKCKCGNEE